LRDGLIGLARGGGEGSIAKISTFLPCEVRG
jgi:hypothetical protein